MYLKDDHISYTSCHLVDEVIRPFRQFGVTFFVYVKIFPDGTRISLNNSVAWSKFFFKNFSKYINGEIFESFETQDQSVVRELWTLKKEGNLLLIDNEREFNLGNGIDITLSGKNYTEFFVFATDKNRTEMNNFFLNHSDLLTQSIFYFKDKGSKIIKDAEKNGLIYFPHEIHKIKKDGFDRERIMNTIQPSRYYLNGKYQGSYLTKSEYYCLKLISEMKSIKEAANMLNLSQRTVEKHINNIKIKFECHKKSDFIEIIDQLLLTCPEIFRPR